MGRVYERLEQSLRAFIDAQPVFFVATAPLSAEGHVNLSPKGGRGTLAVVDEGTVAYLDLTGSGIETAAHVQENGRITLMWCAFEGPPRIVRVHGTGTVHWPGSEGFARLRPAFGAAPGVRSIVEVHASRISDSCGYSVPLMDYAAERPTLTRWAQRKSDAELDDYRATKNARSIDGLKGVPT